MAWDDPRVGEWHARCRSIEVAGERVAVWDLPALEGERFEPLLIVHGFPTSSFDFVDVVERLARHRRVVLSDHVGYGLSAKPDRPYTVAGYAATIVGVTAALGLHRLAMLTHDLGDTVGGELLVLQQAGDWPVEVTRRVVTNGSIYIEMAHLTAGQELLLSLPDKQVAEGPGVDGLEASLVATLSPRRAATPMRGHAELVCHDGGDTLLPRTVRYIEERRGNERRFTGAIESHDSPLHVVWGPEDPVAVRPMAERLVEARPDATLAWVEGSGHYPQAEDPAGWLDAVLPGLE
ncbi:MAG: alpha/beta hydrolase [Acidimicrobiales bacterium]